MKYYRDFTTKENKWITRFEKVMKNAPDTLFMFVGAGIVIYPKKNNNERYMTEYGNVDDNAKNRGIFTLIEFDGGDY